MPPETGRIFWVAHIINHWCDNQHSKYYAVMKLYWLHYFQGFKYLGQEDYY